MSATMPMRGFVSRTTTVVFDFMHGGLVMAGVILTIFLAAFAAGNPVVSETLNAVRQKVARIAPAPKAPSTPPAAAGTAAAVPLGHEMRAVLDSVARRYRVSASALEPVFLTAQASARDLNLDPLLIVAVVAIESGFNPLAESVVGAQGLMQVMPRFHQDKLPDGDARALFDPETNVSIGARILKESIRRMGSLTSGLQQYAGALDDADETYAAKVLGEKQKLEIAARRARTAGT